MGKFARGTIKGHSGGALPPVVSSAPAWRRLRFIPDEARPSVTVNLSYLQSLGLTERDRRIVQLIGELDYMTTRQIARIFYAHAKNADRLAQRKLLQLWKNHLLNRNVGDPLAKAGLPIQLVYMLGKAGRLLLREGQVDDRPLPKRQGTLLLLHNILIGEALTAIIEALRPMEAKWQVLYHGEQLQSFEWQDFQVKMRPDGYLVLSNTAGRELSFFIEMDTGSRPLKDYVKKVLQYEWYFKSGAWRHDETSFPAIAVFVWKLPRDDEDPTWDDRVRASDKRLTSVMEQVQTLRKESKVRWFCARLDQASTGDWYTLCGSGTFQQVHLFESLANA